MTRDCRLWRSSSVCLQIGSFANPAPLLGRAQLEDWPLPLAKVSPLSPQVIKYNYSDYELIACSYIECSISNRIMQCGTSDFDKPQNQPTRPNEGSLRMLFCLCIACQNVLWSIWQLQLAKEEDNGKSVEVNCCLVSVPDPKPTPDEVWG